MPLFGKKKVKAKGTYDDMDDSQRECLESFKKYLVEHDQMTTRYNDYYLLRFCRARNFKLDKVLQMFNMFLDWRAEHKVDESMVIYKCPNMPEVKKMYNFGYHGTDLGGRPFYIDQPCMFDIDDLMSIVTYDELYQYYLREYERLIHVMFPACSTAAGTRIEQTFSLLNMDGFSMSKLKEKSRDFVKLAIKIGGDYYPEIMFKMFIVNTPFMFKAAWTIFKPFIDEKTRDKISIVGSKFQKDLFKYVDPSNVPEFLGGTCT